MNQSTTAQVPCPTLQHTITIDPRMDHDQAVRLAQECRQLGGNRREISPWVVRTFVAALALGMFWWLSGGIWQAVNAFPNGPVSLQFLSTVILRVLPPASFLLLIGIAFRFRIKNDFTNPPLGSIPEISLQPEQVVITVPRGNSVDTVWHRWTACSVKWSDDAWLIQLLPWQVLIPKEMLSETDQQQFQNFVEELNAWKVAGHSAGGSPEEISDGWKSETGIPFRLTQEHLTRISRLAHRLTPSSEQGVFAGIVMSNRFLSAWSLMLAACITAVVIAVWNVHDFWLFPDCVPGLAVCWILWRLGKSIQPAFGITSQITGEVRDDRIELRTPWGGGTYLLSAIDRCQYIEVAFATCWTPPDVWIVLFPDCFDTPDEWQQACQRIEAKFRAS